MVQHKFQLHNIIVTELQLQIVLFMDNVLLNGSTDYVEYIYGKSRH